MLVDLLCFKLHSEIYLIEIGTKVIKNFLLAKYLGQKVAYDISKEYVSLNMLE